MFSLKKPGSYEDTIKKSRFIGTVIPCYSEAEVVLNIKRQQDLHLHASHIAFAFRIKTAKGLVSRFHDAGEPVGTAGKPIYQHIEGKDLINVLITVIRYYGGVKLGAGGLTRAYGNTAKKALEAAVIVAHIEYKTITLTIAYKELQPIEYHLEKLDGKILQQDFSECIELVVSLPDKNIQSFLDFIPTDYSGN